jgi:tRNA-splicing ligase RtcB
MSNFSRLSKALQRQGIRIERNGSVVALRRMDESSEATVLLPDTLPLEQKAVQQLLDFASVRIPGSDGHVCKACATPDFHPGAVAPVGTIVATTSDLVIPTAIGTDINCGMRLLSTGLSLPAFERARDKLIARLRGPLLEGQRNVPIPSAAFRALFDVGPLAWIDSLSREGLWARVDHERLRQEIAPTIGLSAMRAAAKYAPDSLMPSTRESLRDPGLGTVGSGNHFVELQVVDAVLDRKLGYQANLRAGEVVVMLHSGSRDVGFYVGQRWMDRARAAWPQGSKHPRSGLYGLSGPLAAEYLAAMGVAARYAWANRVVLAELMREALMDTFGEDRSRMVVDVPHNVVLEEHGMNVHRKGATPAHDRAMALIPGSMGDFSYLVMGLGNPQWLWSCSHGAGRSLRRQAMRALRPAAESGLAWHCVALRESRRIEEAPGAYKPIGPVIEAQEDAGLIRPVARLRPWITFKA